MLQAFITGAELSGERHKNISRKHSHTKKESYLFLDIGTNKITWEVSYSDLKYNCFLHTAFARTVS